MDTGIALAGALGRGGAFLATAFLGSIVRYALLSLATVLARGAA
jgi:hypothetical protein